MTSNGDPEVGSPSGHQQAPDMSHMSGNLYEKGEGAAFVEHEKNFLDPSRWWFASTAFPLLAGTFGPMASAFSICALAQSWRAELTVKGDPGLTMNQSHQEAFPDPAWLLALNSISLVVAIVANVFLMLNMIRRVPFRIAQPITIGGFLLASTFLVIMVGIAGQSTWKGTPQEDYILTEAFYYACWAAGLYAVIGSLMVVTVWGAYTNHYSKDFQLSSSQRTLMVQTVIFMTYLLVGAAIYSELEGWSFLNAVYWADFTLLTVGIGDHYVPKTDVGRGLIIPFALGGIVSLGLVVNAINGLVLEASGEKLSARAVERKREAVLRSIDYEKGHYMIDFYKRRHFDNTKGMPELDRRKQEFYAMRDIISYADTSRAWTSLTVSLSAFFVLWFCGAAIFMATEAPQEWTYFDALYFSYIILLTIGYGDLEARSNSGRPFFVFWSLLAVPALTVLIGDLSDTVVKGVREFTDYLFRLVTRPRTTLKWTGVKLFTPSYLPPNVDEAHKGGTMGVVMERLKQPDVQSAERAGACQDQTICDVRFYNFLLMREIRQVLMDCDEKPGKQYSYEEWCYYLKLLGIDETIADIHCAPAPPICPPQRPDGSPELFNLARDIDDDGIVQPWSWLGIRSPLMSGKSEPQWIVQRLIIRLQRELHLESYNGPRQVPLQLSEVRKLSRTMDTNWVENSGAETSNGYSNGEKKAT